jgi:hypothetical protein
MPASTEEVQGFVSSNDSLSTPLRNPRCMTAITEPPTVRAFAPIKVLVGSYVGISLLTVIAIALMRNHPAEVNSAVWTRGIIVVLSALLTLSFTVRAARGDRRAYLRLRIIAAIMTVAVLVIIALPGTFPVWMKLEQGACGLLLITVCVLANREGFRALFAAK